MSIELWNLVAELEIRLKDHEAKEATHEKTVEALEARIEQLEKRQGTGKR